MAKFDLVIRSGTIVDGLGGEPFVGDVAIKGGVIAAVGEVGGTGEEEVDASGLLVTPGFVDVHTHYDAQLTWDDRLIPSSMHGATTVVTGNCGVGFAPCKPEQREMLITLMEGVEDIPGVVMRSGIPWGWESFPEFLDALEQRNWDVDVATQVPHAAVRTFVMGQRALDREPALPGEVEQMGELVAEALEVGALGFSTSRTIIHRRKDGALAPTITAGEDELLGIARAVGKAGKGVLQMVDDFMNPAQEWAMWRRIVETAGRPLTFSLGQRSWEGDNWRLLLDLLEQANDDGLNIKAQVLPRPLGLLFGLDLSENPLSLYPAFRELRDSLSREELLAELAKPEIRQRILTDTASHPDPNIAQFLTRFDDMYVFGDPPNYTPDAKDSIGAMAARKGVTALEMAYDLVLENDGRNIFYAPLANYVGNSLDAVGVMLAHRDTIPGVGDGGAHYGYVCDASVSTYLMQHWTSDAAGAQRLDMPYVIRQLTWDCAQAVGLHDRGRIAPGYKADLNVIDEDRLALHAPYVTHDLPSGGRRLLQEPEGYVATIVSGAVTYRDGKQTGARPGKLIRGAQVAPSDNAALEAA